MLDALRQPLESGEVVVARSGRDGALPGPVHAGPGGQPVPVRARRRGPRAACTCTPLARRRYLARLSGPLLDRVDVKVEFLPVGRAELLSDRQFAEPSAAVAARVEAARQRAARRLAARPGGSTREIPGSELRRRFPPAPGALAPLERAMDLGQISARGVDRVIRVSWTLADLAGRPGPGWPRRLRAGPVAGGGPVTRGRRRGPRRRRAALTFLAEPGDPVLRRPAADLQPAGILAAATGDGRRPARR